MRAGVKKIANAKFSHATVCGACDDRKQMSMHEYAIASSNMKKEFKPKINAITILLVIPDAEHENYNA